MISTHDSWIITLAEQRLVTMNGIYKTMIMPSHHVKCGTYKDEYGTGYGGWHIETGKPPKKVVLQKDLVFLSIALLN